MQKKLQSNHKKGPKTFYKKNSSFVDRGLRCFWEIRSGGEIVVDVGAIHELPECCVNLNRAIRVAQMLCEFVMGDS